MTDHTVSRRAHRAVALAICAALVLAGCGGDGRLPDAVAGEAAVPDDDSVSFPPCTPEQAAEIDPVVSYDPLPTLPAPGGPFDDPALERILDSGKLRVGVSSDTLLFGARNLDYVAGNADGELAYEGFDIDMLTEVALAIFGGSRADIGDHIEFKAIPYRDRLPKLQSGEVDVVAHTMTINCSRWRQIAFSAVYFSAGQRVLVLDGSPFADIDDVAAEGATVCVPAASTNEEALIAQFPDLPRVAPLDISDCLVLLQQGAVAAITGDDTVLAGLAAQDPATVVVGPQFTEEPYGMGFAAGDVGLARFVNRLLEDMVDDGRWEAIYSKWLVPSLTTDAPKPPTPRYGRTG